MIDSESAIQTVLDTAIDAIVIIDAQCRIQLFNRAAERMFGYSMGEIIGQNVKILMPPPYDRDHDQYVRNYLTTGVKRIIGMSREVVARRKDGSTFPAKLAVGETTDHPQHRFVGFIRDITEKRQLETRSLRAQRLESIGTLAGGIAHDLNNVLTPILMAIRMLRKPLSSEDRDELLATAQASVERGTALIKQLLTFAGGGESIKSTIQVGEVVKEVRSLLEQTVPKSIEIQVDIAPTLWPVFGDATQLSQVLMNLCVNARDAMGDHGTLTIAAANLSTTQAVTCFGENLSAGHYVRLSVTDTGSGIPPDVMDKMFDPFFTTKEFGRGTGLGLSTVVGIVRGHGGGINVDSEVGIGTQVMVYLPAQTHDVPADQAPTESVAKRGRNQLILIVDDEAPIRIAARQVLNSAGYNVICANDGAEAVKLIREHSSDIRAIVLDMMMPIMDGRATLKELATFDPKLNIIATSGLRPVDLEIDRFGLRPRVYLQKPYSDEELLNAIDEVLRT